MYSSSSSPSTRLHDKHHLSWSVQSGCEKFPSSPWPLLQDPKVTASCEHKQTCNTHIASNACMKPAQSLAALQMLCWRMHDMTSPGKQQNLLPCSRPLLGNSDMLQTSRQLQAMQITELLCRQSCTVKLHTVLVPRRSCMCMCVYTCANGVVSLQHSQSDPNAGLDKHAVGLAKLG